MSTPYRFLAIDVDGTLMDARNELPAANRAALHQAHGAGMTVCLCTDMRDTRDIKRASRFCQQFYLLPAGGGRDGKSPVAGAARVHRAMEHAPLPPPGAIRIAATRKGDGYAMEAHIPATALAGFDPDEHRRIGIYTLLEDVELGQQYLTVGDDLYWHIDPSTWATAVLTRDD